MKIDVDIDKFSGGYKLTFPLSEFNDLTDSKMAIAIIKVFSADMELEPELSPDDIDDIIDKTKELEQERFIVEIYEDGIEVDI
ncbi:MULTISPECIES: hypothetical protein [Halobacteriovorax]|uniref:Uncharacterized protein n=1 Tax=Halobacteriovorax vibrionivorans TaxID=2152716 RepID=A0ABY0ICR2_9BACT|nr:MULTISPECIES: hypothetical protein [Halobacteriovorax]AYF44656.1 hypothetical protein BALOs_1656 [Halobacteriovorax sp. BALOs_7]RZF20741.1 hypothetical protein DAY19_12205 [Halobacteriovorax vibrionivorans]TGD48130.1 hypothetical protein EP118_05025 [Halobacteriovorax sp. Y22]